MTPDKQIRLSTLSLLLSTADKPGELRCNICGSSYTHRRTLIEHMKKHRGETRCPICGQELAVMRNLRKHMVTIHRMPKTEVDRLTNKRMSTMESYGYVPEDAEGSAGATAMPAAWPHGEAQ